MPNNRLADIILSIAAMDAGANYVYSLLPRDVAALRQWYDKRLVVIHPIYSWYHLVYKKPLN